MSDHVTVDRELRFRGAAAYKQNITGVPLTELKVFDETFMGAVSLHGWNEEASNGSTHTHGKTDGGTHVMTCGSTIADCGELSHDAQWSPYYACGTEIWARIDDTTNVCIAAGFVDAKEDDNNHIAGELDSSADLRDATNTTDLALMIYDTDATTDVWYCAVMENDTIGATRAPVAALGSILPVTNTVFKIRIQTDVDGNVWYYYNGKAVGFHGEKIASAATNLLTPYIGIISRSTGAAVLTVVRIITWQEI